MNMLALQIPNAVPAASVVCVLPPMAQVKNGRNRLHRHDLPPGAFSWVLGMDGEPAALDYVCPCGCGAVGTLLVRDGYGNFPVAWDGDEERPTITTLVERSTPCRWRGLLTDGQWRAC